MPATIKSVLKRLFEDNDRPNGQAFSDLIDTFRSVLEAVPAADVSGLFEVIDDRIQQVSGGGGGGGGTGGSIISKVSKTVSGSDEHTLNGGILASNFLIIPTADAKVRIGTALGLSDIFDDDGVTNEPVFLNLTNFSNSTRKLHFTGSFVLRFITIDYA